MRNPMKEKIHKDIASSHILERRDNYGRFGRTGAPSARELARENIIREWVGDEDAPEVFASWRGEAHEAGSVAQAILDGIQPAEIELLELVKQRWSDIVGPDNANQLTALSTTGDVLTVGFYNAAWRFAVDTPAQRQLILRRISELSGRTLKAVRFVAAVKRS